MTQPKIKLLDAKRFSSSEGVTPLPDPERFHQFEYLYLKVREKEGRIYPDSIVKNLPRIEANHPLFREWQMRGTALNRLQAYLAQKSKPLMILEIGCGNGWLAHRLAQIPDYYVNAVDLNRTELEQGARVFSETHSLSFIYGNIFEDFFQPASFDLILLVSSIQYFPNLKVLLQRLLDFLQRDGEIHIIDSPFYSEKSAADSRQRSIDYYKNLGYPEMANHYYQHRWSELTGFNHEIEYNPKSYFVGFRRRFLRKIVSPFPWIIIRHR